MQNLNRNIKTASIVFAVLWLVALVITVISSSLYNASEAEPFDRFLTETTYMVLTIASVMGFISSFLISVSLHFFLDGEPSTLKKSALVSAFLNKLLFWLSICLIFVVHSVIAYIPMLAWCVCTVACALLVVVILVKKRHRIN